MSTTTEKPSPSELPSVLAELGLGNTLPPTTEGTDAPAKPDATPVVATPAETPSESKPTSEAKTEPKAEQKAEPPAKAAETTGRDEELTRLTKRLTDLQNSWTQERQFTKEAKREIQDLKQSIGILTKKFDGTYDEATDGPKPIPPEALVDQAKQSERVASSHWAAVEQYGEEFVMKTIWNDDAPFRKFDGDPAVQARVFGAKLPIVEAIKVVKEAETKAKYGADPDAMRQVIAKEVRADLEKEVRAQILKEFKSKGQAFEEVKGLGGVPSVTNGTPEEKPRLNFESLFPGFVKTAG